VLLDRFCVLLLFRCDFIITIKSINYSSSTVALNRVDMMLSGFPMYLLLSIILTLIRDQYKNIYDSILSSGETEIARNYTLQNLGRNSNERISVCFAEKDIPNNYGN
jgi:hypothetical protein